MDNVCKPLSLRIVQGHRSRTWVISAAALHCMQVRTHMQTPCIKSLQMLLQRPLVVFAWKMQDLVAVYHTCCHTYSVTTAKPTRAVTPREEGTSQNSTTVCPALQQHRRPLTQGPMKQTQNGLGTATGLCLLPVPNARYNS